VTISTQPVLPDLAATTVVAPSPLDWGHSFQVDTMVQNIGRGNAPPFVVRFILTGANGSTSFALFLGDVKINGLAAGASQQLDPTLTLPAEVPNGLSLASLGYGRIAMVIDPDSNLNESLRTNDSAESAPLLLRLLGTDGTSTVPMAPPVGVQSAEQAPPTQPTANTPSLQEQYRLARTNGRLAARFHGRSRAVLVGPKGHIFRREPPATTGGSFTSQLKVFPQKVNSLFDNLWNDIKKL
jgi:hypothetical protein